MPAQAPLILGCVVVRLAGMSCSKKACLGIMRMFDVQICCLLGILAACTLSVPHTSLCGLVVQLQSAFMYCLPRTALLWYAALTRNCYIFLEQPWRERSRPFCKDQYTCLPIICWSIRRSFAQALLHLVGQRSTRFIPTWARSKRPL